jgi:hypothetical protein
MVARLAGEQRTDGAVLEVSVATIVVGRLD